MIDLPQKFISFEESAHLSILHFFSHFSIQKLFRMCCLMLTSHSESILRMVLTSSKTCSSSWYTYAIYTQEIFLPTVRHFQTGQEILLGTVLSSSGQSIENILAVNKFSTLLKRELEDIFMSILSPLNSSLDHEMKVTSAKTLTPTLGPQKEFLYLSTNFRDCTFQAWLNPFTVLHLQF